MFKNIRLRIQYLKKIMPYARGVRRFFIILAVIQLINMQIGIINPIFYKILVDDVIIGKKLISLVTVAAGYIGIFALNFVISSVSTYASNRFFNIFLFKIRMKLWNNYLTMPHKKYAEYTTGDLSIRMDSDVDRINDFMNGQTFAYVIAIASTVVYGAIMLTISWQLAIFSMAVVPFSFYIGNFYSKKEYDVTRQNAAIRGARDSWLNNVLQSWKEIKALDLKRQEYKELTKYSHEMAIVDIRMIANRAINNIIIPVIKDELFIRLTLYLLGGILVMKGFFSVGTLLIFIQYQASFNGSVSGIIGSNISFGSARPSHERMFEILDQDSPYKSGDFYNKGLKGNIDFKNVSFAYTEELGHVLNDISVSISHGEKIAVVGKSGSGKSTFIKLILGMLESTSGTILIDGHDIKKILPTRLHKEAGVVMQDSLLFNMSIRDNLKLARMRATDAEIETACEQAHLLDFIRSLPDGLDTVIGERGVKLSGGQRQRMAIARVFLSKPGIVVFDEATSSLDFESEKSIHSAIEQLGQNETVIIIAHRLSSVLMSDRVIVLKDGKIAGMGHHSELLNHNEAYDELFKEQYIEMAAEAADE